MNQTNDSLALCDFADPAAMNLWAVVTDSVMGGHSKGSIAQDEKTSALFSGVVSLENNGGFASVRFVETVSGLAEYKGFRISVMGDGKSYQFRAHTKTLDGGCAYKHDFATTNQEWREIELPFSDFVLSKHGKLDPEAGAVDPTEIERVSFLIADGQPGGFSLRIRNLEVYK